MRDPLGQLTEKVISRVTGLAQAQQMRLRFAYDALGRMTQAINADATVTLGYDALGQLISEQTEASGTTSLLRHAYDELGNRVQTTLPDGRVLNSLFYGSGHLHQINLDGELVTDIERDVTHRMISRTQGSLVSQFRYDPVGRLLSQTAGQGAETVIARKYEYDEVGNLVSIDDRRNGVTHYSYDPIGRILSAVQPQLSERFAFDPAHNLLDTTAPSGGRIEGNRVRVYEDKRYDYDAHGNVSEKLVGKHTRMRFEWNPAHQLVKSIVARNSSDTAQTTRYVYDPFGRRIAKRDAFGTTRFVWDGNRLLCEQRGSHSRTYVYGEDVFVPLARIDSVSGNDGASLAEVRHLHTDHLGTPRELTDSDGRVVWAAQYRAWGNVLRVVDDEVEIEPSDEEAQALDNAQPIRFQGQYFDNETGLHYNRFRYYDPDVGRFASSDPIGLAGGANAYKYASNPLNWTDPLGLAPCPGGEAGAAGELKNLGLSKRHFLGSLSIPKATGNSLFLGPRSAAAADLAEIQSGAAVRTGDAFRTSSGRIWGVHNSSIHPVSGPDIISVSSMEYNILVQAQKHGTEKALLTLGKMSEKNLLSAEQAGRTQEIIQMIGNRAGE